jgi:hypothetical protein
MKEDHSNRLEVFVCDGLGKNNICKPTFMRFISVSGYFLSEKVEVN